MQRLTFSIIGAPPNWDNMTGLRYNRKAFMALRTKYNAWRNDTIVIARMYRQQAGWDFAIESDPPRTVQIHHRRLGVMDEDGLGIANKPIVDALKSWLRKKNAEGEWIKYEGAGLIYDDNPKHCIILKSTQEKVSHKVGAMTVVTVEVMEHVL